MACSVLIHVVTFHNKDGSLGALFRTHRQNRASQNSSIVFRIYTSSKVAVDTSGFVDSSRSTKSPNIFTSASELLLVYAASIGLPGKGVIVHSSSQAVVLQEQVITKLLPTQSAKDSLDVSSMAINCNAKSKSKPI